MVRKAEFVNPRKTELIDGLNSILGLNPGREWEYLNKGRRALEKLDTAIAACRIPSTTAQLASSDESLIPLGQTNSPPLPD